MVNHKLFTVGTNVPKVALLFLALVFVSRLAIAKEEKLETTTVTQDSTEAAKKVVATYSENLLSINASSVTLKELCKEISGKTGVEIILDKEIEEQKISIEFDKLSIKKGIEKILDLTGLKNLVINYKEGEKGYEISKVEISRRLKEEISKEEINTSGKKMKKILVLHIIEENWDDLELIPSKYRRIVSENKQEEKLTKKVLLKRFFQDYDYKENYKIYKENIGNTFAKQDPILKEKMEKVEKKKDGIKNSIKFSISKGYLSKNSQLCIYHEIKYYGNTYLLEEDAVFIKDAFRIDGLSFNYSYENTPSKIILLTDYLNSDPNLPIWDNYKYIRLVDDIYITSLDRIGNIEIKYDEQVYLINVGSAFGLPVKEKILTKKEIEAFKNYYEEKWGNKIETMRHGIISSSKESFKFITKVNLINYGYVEIMEE